MTAAIPRPARIAELHVYPLKSGHRIELASAVVTLSGLQWDRHWMVVDRAGTFVSQRTHPRLALIVPELAADHLLLRAPTQRPLRVPREPRGASVPVRVWDERCSGLDQGEEAARWVSEALGAEVRLVRVPAAPPRQASARYAGSAAAPIAFPDGYPLLVCNRASLEALNERMPQPVPMTRFRPNVVLEGLEPFAEDRIAEVRTGGVVLRLVKPCTRCVITATDQESGERSTDPLAVLRTFRFDRTLRGVTFGENAVVAAGAGLSLEVGADCTVVPEG